MACGGKKKFLASKTEKEEVLTGLNFGITSNGREIPVSSDSKVTNDAKKKAN